MARLRAAAPRLLISVMRQFTFRSRPDRGFSLGGAIATVAVAAALAVFAGPRVAGAIKRRIAEADGAAQRVASSIEGLFERLPALQGDLADVPGAGASDGPPPNEAPLAVIAPAPEPVPFTLGEWPPRFHGFGGRPLYQPYCRPFRCLPQEELLPAGREPSRKRHRRHRPRTGGPQDRPGE